MSRVYLIEKEKKMRGWIIFQGVFNFSKERDPYTGSALLPQSAGKISSPIPTHTLVEHTIRPKKA